MKLPIEFFNEFEQRFRNENIKIKVIGSRNDLPQELVDKIEYVEEVTKDKTGLTFIIAFNYGSQLEIVEATKNIYQDIINKKLQIEGLTPQIFEQYLFTKDIPSVDLLIRTSGELRISNFYYGKLRIVNYILQKLYGLILVPVILIKQLKNIQNEIEDLERYNYENTYFNCDCDGNSNCSNYLFW